MHVRQSPDRSPSSRKARRRSSQFTTGAIAAALVVAGCSVDDTTAPEVASIDRTSQREEPGGEGEATTETVPRTSTYAGYGGHVPAQYAGTSNWICHPDLEADPCRDLLTTVIEPDGSRPLDELQPAADPRFDCFYVYPTTSADPTPASDLTFDDFEVGGDLAEIPACTTAEEVACVISYSSYPADAPPTEGAEQGRAAGTVERNLSLEDNQQVLEEDMQALCVNPAELAGIDGPVDAVTFTEPALLGWISGFDDVATPFVSLTAVVRMHCEQQGEHTYLAVGLADPSDLRPAIGLVEQRFGPAIGLHLLDANLGQDLVIDVVTEQADAHARGR